MGEPRKTARLKPLHRDDEGWAPEVAAGEVSGFITATVEEWDDRYSLDPVAAVLRDWLSRLDQMAKRRSAAK